MTYRPRTWALLTAALGVACASSEAPPRPLDPPGAVLTAAGELEGRWAHSDRSNTLRLEALDRQVVDVDLSRFGGVPEDVHRLSVVGSPVEPLLFRAAHGKVVLQGVDIDGNGTDEIVLERAVGRGTFVTVRHLEVLRLHDGRFVSMLDVPMDEYLWSSTARDPVLLCRRLSVYEGQRGAILQLRLDPLDLGGQSLPKDLEWAPAQVSVELQYDPRTDAFEELGREVGPLGGVSLRGH